MTCEEEKVKAAASSNPATAPGKIRVGADGNAVLPATMIDAVAKPGDILFVRP
jgi:hypothetical protein